MSLMIGNLSAVFIYSMYRERIRVDACHTAIIKAILAALIGFPIRKRLKVMGLC